MCTCFTHAVIGLVAGNAAFPRHTLPKRFWWLAMACSAEPDIDAGLHAYGVKYGDLWGHRGMAHSLFFAVIVGLIVVTLAFRRRYPTGTKMWWALLIFFTCITASHGILDMFTNGGLGIAVFSPFDTTRYFMPWQPLPVPNMGVSLLFTRYMGWVLLNEFIFVVLPVVLVGLGIRLVRRSHHVPLEGSSLSSASMR